VIAILNFVFLILDLLLSVLVWVVIANAVVSWLVAFDIINLRNRAAYDFVRFLDRATAPLLAPLRRFIPPLGGMDLTPVIFVIIVTAAQRALLPPLLQWLQASLGGGPIG
jgi:YggT family protein